MATQDLLIKGEWRGHIETFRKDRIIVGTLPSVRAADTMHVIETALAGVSGASIATQFSGRRWALVSIPAGADVVGVCNFLATQPGIRYAEPDFLIEGSSAGGFPNDPDRNLQDWIKIVRARLAWHMTRGHQRVLVAVLDSGIPTNAGHLAHRDLSGARYIIHHGSINHDYTGTPGSNLPSDANGHGTLVTGIVAAVTNNAIGVAGVNWSSPVYVARILDAANEDTVGAVMPAMTDLMDFVEPHPNLRVVVNMSFKCTVASHIESLRHICEDTSTGQFILCCAATFYQRTVGSGPHFAHAPACYAAHFKHVVSVGSSGNIGNPKDVVSPIIGTTEPLDPDEVTVVAPGIDVYSTQLGPPYFGLGQGTSMATPIVAGVVSLMWSVAPNLGPGVIRWLLRFTGTKIGTGVRRYRRVNAGLAVTLAKILGFPWF